jgi:hypothetical protein
MRQHVEQAALPGRANSRQTGYGLSQELSVPYDAQTSWTFRDE